MQQMAPLLEQCHCGLACPGAAYLARQSGRETILFTLRVATGKVVALTTAVELSELATIDGTIDVWQWPGWQCR